MFIAFEGIDGSGKTTLSNMLASRLAGSGLSVKHLRAEGKFASRVAESIRALGRDQRNLDLVPEAEFLLYVARDVQQAHEALRPALEEHDVVIADRYFYTAEVLGCAGRGLSEAFVTPILRAAQGGVSPDLTILVDVDPALSRARRKASKWEESEPRPPSRKGLTGTGLQQRLRKGYLALSQAERNCWVVVDNDRSLEVTVQRLIDLVEAARRVGPDRATRDFRRQSEELGRGAPGLAPNVGAALERFMEWVDERAEREPQVAAYLLGGLTGESVVERRRALLLRAPKGVLIGLRGLEDESSWELRHELKRRYPAVVASTLSGVTDVERADELRAELVDAAPEEVIASTARLESERAWAARARFQFSHPNAVMSSLAGLHTMRAWTMRDAWLASRWGIIREDYQAARALARSVSGVSGERAWALREAAHDMAPTACVASIAGLSDEKAWGYRRRYLRSATKIVMASLRGIDSDLAWEMRSAVASECREALDGIVGAERPEAWALRDRLRDVWPSTVVKSLGPLADDPRGSELVKRQLAVHGRDLSLLKHAARIALGAHRITTEEEAP